MRCIIALSIWIHCFFSQVCYMLNFKCLYLEANAIDAYTLQIPESEFIDFVGIDRARTIDKFQRPVLIVRKDFRKYAVLIY